MEKYAFFIFIIVALFGLVGLVFNSGRVNPTGAVFLSERICGPGATMFLYDEKDLADGYFKPTVVCIKGNRIPALRGRFILGEENADKFDAFRSDPYRFQTY